MERYIPRMPGENEPIPAQLNLRCMNCDYVLTGLIERRCPECGTEFDPRETWLDNERSTWDYHFENRRSKADYGRMAYLGVVILFFFGLVCIDAKTLFALPLIVLGEMYILHEGRGGLLTRMKCWTVAVIWGVAMALI